MWKIDCRQASNPPLSCAAWQCYAFGLLVTAFPSKAAKHRTRFKRMVTMDVLLVVATCARPPMPDWTAFRCCLLMLPFDAAFQCRCRLFGGSQLATPTGWRPCTPTGPFRDTLFQQLTDAAAKCKPDLAEQVSPSTHNTQTVLLVTHPPPPLPPSDPKSIMCYDSAAKLLFILPSPWLSVSRQHWVRL